ncbi:MAG: iron ABC transporter permease [Sphaerochaetaceae bacterium]|nr:iron ABC transporter permease [Sphaerochaetaceae bacterium]
MDRMNRIDDSASMARMTLVLLCSLVLVMALAVVSVCIGAAGIGLSQLWDVLVGRDTASSAYRIVMYVRLPRTLAAVLAGMALAVAGAILQVVLNNPLAGPNIIGVNAGAGLSTMLLTAFFPAYLRYTPVAAFVGSFAAVMLVYGLARRTGASRMTIVLAGVAVSSLLSACTDTIITLVPDVQFGRMDFLIGSFSSATMDQVRFAVGYILVGCVVALFLGYDMNVLALGDDAASSLGLRVKGCRLLLLAVAALLAGSAISICGLIGFVGLVVPHIARMLVGHDNRYLVPVSATLGAASTLACDMLARTLFAPYELPVGIVLSFLGSPFFLYLLVSRKRRSVLA